MYIYIDMGVCASVCVCKHILCIHKSYINIYIYILSISFSSMEKPSTHGPLMDAPFHFAHVIRSNFGHLKPQGHPAMATSMELMTIFPLMFNKHAQEVCAEVNQVVVF